MKQHLLNSLILLFALIAGTATSWAETVTLTSAQIKAGSGSTSYGACTATDGGGNTWNAYAIKNQHSNATSDYHHWQIKKYASSTAYYVQVPTLGTIITQLKITVSSTSKSRGNGGNTATLYFSSSNSTSATGAGVVSGTGASEVTIDCSSLNLNTGYITASGAIRIWDIEVTYTTTAPTTCATPSISGDAKFLESTEVSISCGTDGATIQYSTDDGANWNDYSAPFTITETTTVKAKATKAELDPSDVASMTFTKVTPMTVAEAKAYIDAGENLANQYVRGKISQIDSYSSNAITYWISDDGTTTNQMEVYKGKGLNNANFTAITDLEVGDVVVVYGTLTKYNSIYEFGAGSQLYSLDHPVVPTILTTPAAISDLDYVTGNGPSAAQTFTVSGSNLTADITLALSGTNFEMSLNEGSGYTNSLTLTQTAGAVAETTVYVRLKEGLEINDYAGTITLTSAGATDKTIGLTGSVTPTLFTWDLSTNSYDADPSTESISWTNAIAVMENNRNGSGNTAVNNYIPTTRTSTRFYKNNIITITPTSGYMITSVEFTATTEDYAAALANSTWTNASAAASETTVTVTPTDGVSAITATIGAACGFTAVKVYYQTAAASINIAAACTDGATCYGTYSSRSAFIVPADLTVYEVSVLGGELYMEKYATDDIVPANTGVLVAGDAGDHDVTLTTGGTSKLDADNMLRASGAGIDAAAMDAADASCKFYRLTMHEGTQIGFFWGADDGAAFSVAANKAYLAVPNAEAGAVKGFRFGENTDAIIEIMRNGENEKMSAIYDLSGRRVMKPTKGLYIMNGKKVVK